MVRIWTLVHLERLKRLKQHWTETTFLSSSVQTEGGKAEAGARHSVGPRPERVPRSREPSFLTLQARHDWVTRRTSGACGEILLFHFLLKLHSSVELNLESATFKTLERVVERGHCPTLRLCRHSLTAHLGCSVAKHGFSIVSGCSPVCSSSTSP